MTFINLHTTDYWLEIAIRLVFFILDTSSCVMHQLCCQGKSNEKELGLFILGVAADSAGGEFKIFLKPFMSIFHSALQDSKEH